MRWTADFDGFAVVVVPDAVIAEAEAELGRVDVPQPFDVTLPGCEKARQPVQQIEVFS